MPAAPLRSLKSESHQLNPTPLCASHLTIHLALGKNVWKVMLVRWCHVGWGVREGGGGLSKAAAIYTDEAVSLLFFTRTHRCDLLPRFHSAAASVSLWSCCLFPRPLLFTARVLGLHFNPESSAKSPRTSISLSRSLSPLDNEIRWHLSGVGCLGEVA